MLDDIPPGRVAAVLGAGALALIAAAAAASVDPAGPATAVSSPVVVVSAGEPTGLPAQPVVSVPVTPPAESPVAAPRNVVLPGVNIAGGEFGKVPGRMNYDYVYPTTAEIDYYRSCGFRILRVPFRWERLQPTLYGPLAAADRAALKAVTDHATSKGMVVVLDMHDYARRRPTAAATANAMVGSVDLGVSALADAWTKIADDYRGDPDVWLGLMNEPSGLAVADWWRSVQQLVLDLRGQRITNRLLVPGGNWTGAQSWVSSGNAAQAVTFRDPGANFAFELHQYLDKDSSGTGGTCVAGSAGRVNQVLTWAEARKVKVFFGEIAASADPQCAVEYKALLTRLNASPAVAGWTAWGGGRWWASSYMFRLASPTGSEPTAHMLLLQQNMPAT